MKDNTNFWQASLAAVVLLTIMVIPTTSHASSLLCTVEPNTATETETSGAINIRQEDTGDEALRNAERAACRSAKDSALAGLEFCPDECEWVNDTTGNCDADSEIIDEGNDDGDDNDDEYITACLHQGSSRSECERWATDDRTSYWALAEGTGTVTANRYCRRKSSNGTSYNDLDHSDSVSMDELGVTIGELLGLD